MMGTQETRGLNKLIKSTILNCVAELNEGADELEKLVYSNENADNILAEAGKTLDALKDSATNYGKAFSELLDRIRAA